MSWRLEKLVDVDAHEGPVVANGGLYFTTIAGLIKRLDLATRAVTVLDADVARPNGMWLASDGRLLVCEQGTLERNACISAVDPVTGAREVLVTGPLNSPNDVVQTRDGAIWFTDPSYGFLQGFRPTPAAPDAVYRFDGELHVVSTQYDKPNGIAFSPDESVLYVGDNGAGVLYANGRAIARFDGEHPDGLKVGPDGRIYASSPTGVDVLSADGRRLDRIPIPGAVNFWLDGGRLLIAADDAVHLATERTSMTPFVRTRRIIDEAGADAVLRAAVAKAREQGSRVSIAVVDWSGEVVAQQRTPGTQVASSRVAVDKARTAAIFIRSSRELEQQVTDGRLGALALHGAHALIGGIPLTVGDEVVGAVGASGETTGEDEAIAIAGAAADYSTVEAFEITQAGARMVASAVGAAAASRGVAPVVSVVDSGGELVYLHRPDAAQVASVGVTTDKARTAAIYRRPSRDFEEQASNGRPSALHLARAVPLQGGIPLEWGGQVVGAVGVSGASSADEDQELAVIGAAALSQAAAVDAAFISASDLDMKFRTGGIVVDAGRYKIDAGRREAPGEVEYHEDTVDVMHVVSGTATVVTGGEMVDAREVGPGELRAPAVRGGTPHALSEGDVLAIPNGVPHQFVDVSDPFLYFVVKVGT
jgi:uncharacterized protein GlcG (DUF336 family)/sugar lactone lactonase YvrE/mannose-6-phosphate isomerase-like protein (cupin superfamily)